MVMEMQVAIQLLGASEWIRLMISTMSVEELVNQPAGDRTHQAKKL